MNMHAQLMLLLHWDAEKVWNMKIFLAIRLLQEDLKLQVTRTRITALVVSTFLSRNPQAHELLNSITGEKSRPLTIKEEFGEEVAREVEELEARNRKWLEERRK